MKTHPVGVFKDSETPDISESAAERQLFLRQKPANDPFHTASVCLCHLRLIFDT